MTHAQPCLGLRSLVLYQKLVLHLCIAYTKPEGSGENEHLPICTVLPCRWVVLYCVVHLQVRRLTKVFPPSHGIYFKQERKHPVDLGFRERLHMQETKQETTKMSLGYKGRTFYEIYPFLLRLNSNTTKLFLYVFAPSVTETREKDLVYFHKQTISSEFFPYSNGSFLIKKRGIYYVFSQIKYDHDPESAENNNAKQTHALHRYTSSGGFETLIENTRTFSQLQRPENTGTSFISSAFDLKDGDKIMIKSTHTHKLTGGRSENFFGLYVI